MSEKIRQVVTVVPPEPVDRDGGPTKTQGTRVILADGSELHGVRRIDLIAEPASLWSGTVHLYPKMGVMKGMTVHIQRGTSSWWRTLLCRLAGVVVEESYLELTERRFRSP